MEIGIKGISYSATERKYLVRIKKDSKRVYVGRYSSLKEAKEALESYVDAPKTQSTTPILESLRATFAPKKTKVSSYKTNSSKAKPSETVQMTKVTTKNLSATVRNSQNSSLKVSDFPEKPLFPAIDEAATGAVYFRLVLAYLIKEADRRGTSVFDVVVQEVANLSK